jgi:hypothetical protein
MSDSENGGKIEKEPVPRIAIVVLLENKHDESANDRLLDLVRSMRGVESAHFVDHKPLDRCVVESAVRHELGSQLLDFAVHEVWRMRRKEGDKPKVVVADKKDAGMRID